MHILLKGKCNNDCVFCNVSKDKKILAFQIKKKINSFDPKSEEKIVFTGAEPTIRKDIFDLLKCAKKSKARIIQLNTNGRMLSDKKFAQEIVKAGANYFKISLYGHSPQLHDEITQTKDSFKQTIKGIRNLIKLGQKDNIVLSVVLNRLNYKNLPDILELIKRFKIKKIQLNVAKTTRNDLLVPLDVLADYISKARYQFFFDFLIKVKSIPYCLIPEPESLFLKSKRSKDYIYTAECKMCKYNKICSGVLRKYVGVTDISKIKAFPDLPKEVMIEVTPRCNFHCQFCFNRVSFAKEGHLGKELSTTRVKKIIDNVKKSGVSIVRFTGGEPMLRKDIFELIRYAKLKGLKVRLNTNGSLIKSYNMAKEMTKYLDYVLFSLHTCDSKEDEKITGFKHSFEKKIRAIKWFRKAGINIIRINTIATLKNIKNLERFYNLMKELKIDRWAINRLIPVSKKDKLWGKQELPLLIEKLVKIKKDKFENNVPTEIHIVNAVPLCAYDPVKMNAVCSGGRSVDGHERFVIDPRGFAKPIYYMGENIGNPLDILDCWNHSFMKSMRYYKTLPIECKKCPLLEKCKGGNRFCAYMTNGTYQSPDPLMDYSKIRNYIW